jgi:hypothetical protein
MGYDLRPLELLKEKRMLLGVCADEGVLLVHEHEMKVPASKIQREGDDFSCSSFSTGAEVGCG